MAPDRLAEAVLVKRVDAVKLRIAKRVADTETVAHVVCVMRSGLALVVRLTAALGLALVEPESDRDCNVDGDSDADLALDRVGITVALGLKLDVTHADALADPDIETTADAVNESDVELVTDAVPPGESVLPMLREGDADVDCVAHTDAVVDTVGDPRAERDVVALIVTDNVRLGLAESDRLTDALGVADADREPDTDPLVERDASGEFDASGDADALGDVDGDGVTLRDIAALPLTVALGESVRDAGIDTVSVDDFLGDAVVEGDGDCVSDRLPDGDADVEGDTEGERRTDGERDGDAVPVGDGRVDGDNEGDAVNDRDGGGDAETEVETEVSADIDALEEKDDEATAEGVTSDVRVLVAECTVAAKASAAKKTRAMPVSRVVTARRGSRARRPL